MTDDEMVGYLLDGEPMALVPCQESSVDTMIDDLCSDEPRYLYLACMISKFPIRDAGWADVCSIAILFDDPTIDAYTIDQLRFSRKQVVKVDNPFGMDFIEELWIRTAPYDSDPVALADEGFSEATYVRVEETK